MFNKISFLSVVVFCLSPWANSALALGLGIAFAFTLGNPFAEHTRALTPRCLSLAVVGLGAGMNLMTVTQVGAHGFGFTVISIGLTFLLGSLMGRLLKIQHETSLLITVGTAICGGSAIAALAPVLRAKSHQVSVALGLVFLLNAVALFVFPTLGHFLGFSETQFGLWSALAIHDTSSVVGASLAYGPRALEVGTTVKLARALWIVPVTLAIGMVMRGEDAQSPKRPWFILGFLMMAAIFTFNPALGAIGHMVETGAKHLLILTLFLIGTNLTVQNLKTVGFGPVVQAVTLWLVMSVLSAVAIENNWFSL